MTTLRILELMTIEGIDASLSAMPQSTYRRYCRWILSRPELSQEWLQLVGMRGLNRLTVGLLDGLLTKPELDMLLPYSVPINVFCMYEVMADNLSLGLAYRLPHDNTFEDRQQIVKTVNDAMVERLRGGKRENAVHKLTNLAALNRLSTFDNSLSPSKHRQLAQAFSHSSPDYNPAEIEFSLYPILLANIESCRQVVETLDGYLTQELVEKGFVRRFAGQNRLLDETHIARNYLLQIAANTIMVQPLLGYYIAVIAEEVHLIHNYEAVVENGLLLKALEDAALIVRLLNDLGIGLLEQSGMALKTLCHYLRAAQIKSGFATFHDLLLDYAEHHADDPAFTRLLKDVKFGEFNLALYEPYRCALVTDAIDVFGEQLNFLSQVYDERWDRLRESLDIISFETRSTLIADIILRFIKFHEVMYRAAANTSEGEYAV